MSFRRDHEADLTASGPQGDLSGTLIKPADGKPLVLILPGSGPTDRDGNNPAGVTAAPYRLLAEALAQDGIGTLRIDKRGMFGSSGAVANPNDVTIADYAADVESWIASAKAATGVECVWVMGHSEGGLSALKSANSSNDICGIMLVASVGRPAGEILREQLQSNPENAPILESALTAISTLESGQKVDVTGMHPALMGLFNPAVQGFLIDLMAQKPAEMIAEVEVPILIVAGGKDIQTPVTDGKVLSEANSDAEFVVLDDMNHILKSFDGDDRASNIATYGNAELPIHPGLVEAITTFLNHEDEGK